MNPQKLNTYNSPIYPHYIRGVNNSAQYLNSTGYRLLINDPYYKSLPDQLSKHNTCCLPLRSQIIYNNSSDKNWGPQTTNRFFWEKQNKTYESSDQLLQDKIDKIKYEETKRHNSKLKNVPSTLLTNGYGSWNSKNNNWYYHYSRESKKHIKSNGNIGINSYIYNGDSYKIPLENTNTDSLCYCNRTYKYGGNQIDNWYKYKPNYIKTNNYS